MGRRLIALRPCAPQPEANLQESRQNARRISHAGHVAEPEKLVPRLWRHDAARPGGCNRDSRRAHAWPQRLGG